ncbi:MAG: SDR family oxidoreductase [Dehalococcoidales bacterium]|jgi:NAD(P)-dependent dehydrogenase (short-subunit alcohol dehydrogenase family)|nr:3-oxoacyl-ACP reductase [Dehalococcoidales bacterium]MDP6126711.1 SDR family oxidoreductase [Dehalococcoidales bacterium]MDP6501861.1 SDR family oxidoreductase [Dehalococcoidales bacterium]MDP7525308.1 SDR family oxidoreductase [Dehalococcoidales bacterium]
MDSNERVAIVTGAGSGIGKYSALALLKDGYSVVLAGRRPERLQSTLDEAEDSASRALAVPTDVDDPQSVQALFARTSETFGRLDVLFNNAGTGGPPVLFEDLTYDQWKRVLDTNLTGVFLCSQEAVKIMKRQQPMGGRIINNGSISASTPRPNSAPYTSTKHAVTGLTKAIALDGRKYDITCSQIDIGNAATDLTAKMKNGIIQADGAIEVEPTFDVNHVAEAVLFMANLPLDTNVLSMTIMATKMPYVGRG